MNTLAIVPVKDLECSKSRLSPHLDEQRRQSLALRLLQHTISVLKSAESVSDILLVSRDEKVRSLAEIENIRFLTESGAGLNRALEQATAWSVEHGFSSILILPLDLPLISNEDIDGLIGLAGEKSEIVVIAPDVEKKGTNALLVRPPGIMGYRFGPGSFRAHCEQAEDKGIAIKIYNSPRVGFDLDTPAQYKMLSSRRLLEPGCV